MGLRGRPQTQQNPGVPGYSGGYNQYPQNPQQGSFRGQTQLQSQNFNRQRRDRARPRYQYSYYSEDSLSSNYPFISRGGFSNAGGFGRGRGLINNAAMMNLPAPKLNDRVQNNPQRKNDRSYDNRPGSIRSSTSNDRLSIDRPGGAIHGNDRPDNLSQNQSRNDNRYRRDHHDDIQPTMYFCPKCGENYNSRHTQFRYAGKIPLILHCSHTMCQECIYQSLKNYKVTCPTCQTESTLTQEQTPVCQSDMQNVFLPNFYILGVMSYYKTSGGHLKNLENMTFVSTGLKKMQPSLPSVSDRCCFGTCTKEATMFCPSCEGIYCSDCCTVVHKSTKILMTHEPTLRRRPKFSLMLENCGEHPTMQVEFFCRSCDLTACCYCVLDKHADHDRVALFNLNNTEMEEFKRLKKVAEKALKEILSAQKKSAKLANFNTGSVKKDVCKSFADYHAKLECLEKKLCDELETFKANNRGLETIQSSLMASAEQLKHLVAFNVDNIGDKKLNLRGALEKLRNIDKIPRFLLNENGQAEPVRFFVNNTGIDALEENFTLEKCEDSTYRLVREDELPDDYVAEIDESDPEVEETISAIINKSNQNDEVTALVGKTSDLPKMVPASSVSSLKSKRSQSQNKTKEPGKKKLDMERVEVQHINSMESFFVQYKSEQAKLSQLNKDMENYVKMGGAEAVKEPQLHDLYLALYVVESHNQKEQKWCRARLTEIKNTGDGPEYEMFFIDYGKTQFVDGTRIRDIPTFLTQKKPFAIECMMHNPMGVNWSKKAHYSLAKILMGKDVYMMEKSYNQGIYEVDLMISSSDGGVTSVTDILVHAHNSVEPQNDDNTSVDGSVTARKDGYYPMLRVFPNSKKFTKNQKENVVIATVVDPYNVFVHLVKYQTAFKTMNHSIKKAYKNAKSSVPIEGTYALVEYKDPVRSNWHRAFIKSVDFNTDKVHVLLVDWGLNVVVPSQNVRPLQESFTKLESQAVLIKLAHVAPFNKQAVWSPYASNFLQKYHQTQDVLKMLVQETEPELEVALFDISSNVDICLNAMMAENNLADSTGPISSKLEWPHYEATNPEFSEDDGLMASMLKRVDEAIDDSDEEDFSGVKKRRVDIVRVDAPDLIWVKFLEFRERESAMFKELQIHYSQEQRIKSSWNEGDLCVTEIGHEFARGKVLEKIGNEYKIYLVDKANEIMASIEKIYVYDKYFARYPQAVTKSHLANIRPAGDTGKWSISSIEALQEIFTKQKRIYANKAPESDSELSKKSLPLDMWYGLVIPGGPLDPDQMKYVYINKSLVKLGFAYKIPPPVTPKASTSKDVSKEDQLQEPVATELPVKKASGGEDLLKSLIKTFEPKEHSEPAEESNADNTNERNHAKDTLSKTETTKNKYTKGAESGKKITILKKGKNSESGTKTFDLLVQGEPDDHAGEVVRKPIKSRKTSKGDEKIASEGALAPSKVVDLAKAEHNEKKEKPEESDKNLQEAPPKRKEIFDPDEEPIQNWNEIVEKELGEPGAAAKTLGTESEECSPYHKSEVAIDDWLPPYRLTKKDFKARVTCVETGGHLYLHEVAMDEVYYKMQANIKEYFDTNPPEITDHKWEPGQLCTIKFTDKNWYRGKILKVKSPKEISVFMIDFGSDHDMTPDVLFREVLYTDVGAFATKVKLDKVYARSGSWLTSDYDHFHDLVTDWCRIVVKGPVEVEQPLVEVYNEHGVFVNQKLVEMCPNLSRCSNFPVKDEPEEDDNVVIESIESDEESNDEMLMDNFERELDARKSLRDQYLLESSKETMKYQTQPLPEDLLEGKKVVMEIGGFPSYDKVALRFPGADLKPEVYDLLTEIQDDVTYLPNLEKFTVGMPCLAPFSEDGAWYRARISGVKTVDLGYVDVIFIDYGNSEAVSTKNVKVIRPDHLTLPPQTWEASINVALKDDADVITVMQVMNSLDKKKKHVKLVKESPLTVDLYEKNEKLCYQTLINSGSLKPLFKNDDTK